MVKISKFRLPTFFGMVICIFSCLVVIGPKTLGQVCKNRQNKPILTSKLTLVGRQKTYYQGAPIFPTSMSWKFREDGTMARRSKGCGGQMDKSIPISTKSQMKIMTTTWQFKQLSGAWRVSNYHLVHGLTLRISLKNPCVVIPLWGCFNCIQDGLPLQ